MIRVVRLLFMLIYLGAFAAWAQGIPVEVFYPQVSQSNQVLQLTGTVEAEQHAELASLQAGLVQALFVEIGDRVEKDQKLMALDATLAKLNLAEAEASLEAAKVSRQEAKRLYQEVLALSKKQVVAQTLIAERNAALASAQADLARQQAALSLQQEIVARHTLYAPFAGVIAARNADLGEWVSQQNSVFTLVKQGALRLSVAVPQEYYAQLIDAKQVKARVEADVVAATPILTTLSRLVAVSNSQSRTMTAHIDLPADTKLVAGMSASVQISLPQGKQALVWLPRSAVKLHPDGGSSVFAVVNNKAKRVLVNVVERRADQVAVSNASAQQGYVVSGVELLREGSALLIKPAASKP